MNTAMKFRHTHYDAIVVGARCAGSATAMLMAREGARVLLVDKDLRLHDTLSTHAMMRPAISLLARWGLLEQVVASGAAPVTQTKFMYGDELIDIAIKPGEFVPSLFAPRRWALDGILRDAAVTAGVEFHRGVSFESLDFDTFGRVSGANLRRMSGHPERISADLVVGADGLRSSVAKAVGAQTLMRSQAKSATFYSYVSGVANEGYRWYYADGIAAGLIPTNDGLHCLFASTQPKRFAETFTNDAFAGMTGMLSIWEPDLASELASRPPTEGCRKFPGCDAHVRDCVGPGWALVGDAGFFKDPASAHGITDAFLDAARLASAFARSPTGLSQYQADRDRHAPAMFSVTQKMAALDWDLEELKGLHLELNACMKSELDDLPNSNAVQSDIAA